MSIPLSKPSPSVTLNRVNIMRSVSHSFTSRWLLYNYFINQSIDKSIIFSFEGSFKILAEFDGTFEHHFQSIEDLDFLIYVFDHVFIGLTLSFIKICNETDFWNLLRVSTFFGMRLSCNFVEICWFTPLTLILLSLYCLLFQFLFFFWERLLFLFGFFQRLRLFRRFFLRRMFHFLFWQIFYFLSLRKFL